MDVKDVNKVKADRYTGGNETIDRLLGEHFTEDVVWIVQGAGGRDVIVADTEEQAKENYIKKVDARVAQYRS